MSFGIPSTSLFEWFLENPGVFFKTDLTPNPLFHVAGQVMSFCPMFISFVIWGETADFDNPHFLYGNL